MSRTRVTDKDTTIAALKTRVTALETELRLTRDPVLRFDVDRKRRISNANEALAFITGRSVKKLEGLEFGKLTHGRIVSDDTLFDHLLKGTPFCLSAKLAMDRQFDESGRHFRLSFRPKKDARGRIRGFRVVGRDVTTEYLTGVNENTNRHVRSIYWAIDGLRMGLFHAFNRRGGGFTRSTRIGGVTEVMASGLGYTMEPVPGGRRTAMPELEQHPVTRLLTPETIRTLNARLKDGKEGWVEGEILARDGSRRPARLSITQHADTWIKRSHFAVIVADRSEDEKVLRGLHESLVESEEKHRSLFESASDPIFLEDFDGNILDCNRRACRLYGYSREEMLALNVGALLAEDTIGVLPTFRKEIRRNGHAIIEARNRCRDGSVFDVELSASTVEIGGRELVHVICRDITKRKRAEQETLVANERLQYLLSSTPAVIYTSRTSGDYGATFISDNVTEVVGYKPHDFVERSSFWIDHIHPDDVQRVFRELPQLFARDLHTHEYRFRRKDGTYIWLRDELRLVRDREGKPIEIVGLWIDITERKRTEEALRASEKRYRAIVEDQTELICRFRPDGRLTFVNEAYCRYFDKKPEELVGKRFLPLIPKEDKERVQRDIAALNRKHPAGSHEHRVITPTGEIRWQQWTNRAIFDDQGTLVEFQSVGRDITKRKRAEEAMKESEARYRSLFDSVPVGLFRSTRDGRVLDANPALLQIAGHPDRKSVLEATAADFYVDVNDREKWQAVMERDGIVRDFETRFRRGDGTVMWAQVSARVIRDPNGRILYSEGAVQDITGRKLLEREIRESEEKYRALVESSPDAVFLHDRDGRYLYINSAGARYYGKEPADIVGKTLAELIPKERAQDMLKDLSRVFREQTPVEGEYALTAATGSHLFSTILAPIRNDDGAVTAVIGIARDVTEQKVLQEQLQRAARLASVGTLAAGVAHEINNPLAVISVDLLRMKRQYEDEPGIARLCSKLMRMTKRISGITGGLLTFSKARGGILETHPLHGALDGALELVRSRFDFEQKRLVRDYPKKLPSVWCDSDQLQQVFVNVAINALEAMRKGNTLTVSARTSRKDKTVTLRFADNGKGMTAEEVKRAFDPFYTTKETGSGLGLSISHSIVEEHGGRITITSRPGEGTAVSVVLPVYEPRQPRARTGPRRPNRKKQEK